MSWLKGTLLLIGVTTVSVEAAKEKGAKKCSDGKDNDGDGDTDCDDSHCSNQSFCSAPPPPSEDCTNGVDDDGDVASLYPEPGGLLDWNRIRDANISLRQKYHDLGFAGVIISGKGTVSPSSGLLDYRVRVIEGRRQEVGSVSRSGLE